MSVLYPLTYKKLYDRLSAATGMSNQELDILIIKLIKLLSNDLHRTGKAIVPYIGQFNLKRMPPRKRTIEDFSTGDRHTINIPAEDKLKFTINSKFSKLFR